MNKHNIFYGCGALTSVLLAQAAAKFTYSPTTASRLSAFGCSGTCGNCSAACVSIVAPMFFMAALACRNKHS